jgi:hypothetical protein
MATSRSAPEAEGIRKAALELCWGAWAELGVSGWGRTHQDWAIDPEPLVIFTAGMAESDPRLRDEVVDWCVRNWRHVSQTRLRHILTRQSEETLDEWGRLAATVNARAGTHWPRATTERTAYKTTGRSTLRPLIEPSLVLLRMRTVFGLSARTEILRYFLFHPWERATAAMLAETANYAKRNVADACDMLAQAGVLSSKGVGNRFYFSLAPGDSLTDFVGAVPNVAPDWNALLRIVAVIVKVAEETEEVPHDALVVEVHQAIRDIDEDLDVLDIDPPRRPRGAAVLDEWSQWTESLMKELATGVWPEEHTESTMTEVTAGSRRIKRLPERTR